MEEYPRIITGDEISPRLRSIVASLAERLIKGLTPSHAILLEQYSRARLRDVELTGAGFFAHFEVPKDTTRVEPARVIGGSVSMDVEGVRGGAGSLLSVSDGRINYVEVYLYASNSWPEDANVLSYLDPVPISFGAAT
jgi:hypothetical protein